MLKKQSAVQDSAIIENWRLVYHRIWFNKTENFDAIGCRQPKM